MDRGASDTYASSLDMSEFRSSLQLKQTGRCQIVGAQHSLSRPSRRKRRLPVSEADQTKRASSSHAGRTQGVAPRWALKTTAVFDTYWRFAAARQDLFMRRVSGA